MPATHSLLKKLIPAILTGALTTSSALGFADTSNASPTLQLLARAAPSKSMPAIIPSAPNISSDHYVLLDSDTGNIIAQKNIEQRRPPASLTKLMTLYIIFSALDDGQIQLDEKVPISKKAWQMGGSKMFVKVGTRVPVKDLIQGIIVASGNDACVAMAQFVAGNEKTFAGYMNTAAKNLGMTHSHFVDSTGLPKPDHYTTPGDLAILANAIVHHFPQYYHFFSEKWFKYNNIRQPNRNRLLWRDPSVDGMKTGHTKAAGYCLIASAHRNDTRLISVVMNTPSDEQRADASQALMNYGFRYYETKTVYSANSSVEKHRVWMGDNKYVDLGVANAVNITIPKGHSTQLTNQITLSKKLVAPIQKGSVYGTLKVLDNGKLVASSPLTALDDVQKGGLLARVRDRVLMMFEKQA
jgi:serine-type D-Ala-D-Ala carboxypeptidase (penicillin-binding protein 5/6)